MVLEKLKLKATLLRSNGATDSQIARAVKRSRPTIRRWFNPEYERQSRTDNAKYFSTPEGNVRKRLWNLRYMAKVRGHKPCNATADEVLLAKPKCCPVCGRRVELSIDHCHKTGRFRGWLCRPCNRMLGSVNEDVRVLKRAIQYLLNRKGKS